MKNKIVKTVISVLIAIFVTLLSMDLIRLFKYSDKVRYIEDVLDIRLKEMVEDIDGTVEPGSTYVPATIQLKITVKKECKKDFLKILYDNFYANRTESALDHLELTIEENRSPYASEIKSAGMEISFLKCVAIDNWSTPIFIYVTDQNDEMIVYIIAS